MGVAVGVSFSTITERRFMIIAHQKGKQYETLIRFDDKLKLLCVGVARTKPLFNLFCKQTARARRMEPSIHRFASGVFAYNDEVLPIETHRPHLSC